MCERIEADLTEARRKEFEQIGFRFLDPTTVTLKDGRKAVVKASAYRKSKHRPGMNKREVKILRLYTITYDNGETNEVDENELDHLLG